MIRRRSLDKKKSLKRSSKSRKRSRKRSFGKKIKENKENKENVFGVISNFVSPKKLLELLIYTRELLRKTLLGIKPHESVKLNCIEKIQRSIINLYRDKIDIFVKNLTPNQIILITEGKYNNELRNKFLWNIEPEKKQISGFKGNAKLFILKNIFGQVLIHSIKEFIETLTSDQLVLLMKGKYNLNNALYNAFLQTKFETLKPKVAKQMTKELETSQNNSNEPILD